MIKMGTFTSGLLFGVLGTIAMTLAAPWFIRLMFTPPVSFGINCEPAASWSMQALKQSQLYGFGLGFFLSLLARVYFRKKTADSES